MTPNPSLLAMEEEYAMPQSNPLKSPHSPSATPFEDLGLPQVTPEMLDTLTSAAKTSDKAYHTALKGILSPSQYAKVTGFTTLGVGILGSPNQGKELTFDKSGKAVVAEVEKP